jgi:hypothetical protein
MPFELANSSLLSSRQQLVKMGKMFTVTNPTPGTQIQHANKTSVSATANGLFVIANNNPAGSGVNIYLDQLTMVLTAAASAPTGTLVQHYEVYNETGIVAGTTAVATRTPVNLNPAYGNATNAVVQSFATGAITIPAAVGTRKLMAVHTIATGVAVTHDTLCINFGADGGPVAKNGGAAARATDPAVIVSQMPAVCIAPQTTSWINQWWVTAAVNTPNYEFALTYLEIAE